VKDANLGGGRFHQLIWLVAEKGDPHLRHFGDLAIPALVAVGMILVLLSNHFATFPVAFSGLCVIDLLKELGDSSHGS